MPQTAIPFLFMRGGTSRGPYFRRIDLPEDQDQLSKVLLALIGSGHPFNIDGIGGGTAVTTKIAMLSESENDWADIDYFFAQASVEDSHVDYKPTCGNMLSGVGPAALEMGLVEAGNGETIIKIRATNTGARVIATVKTPDRLVNYEGDTAIDGVPGTASPVKLLFMDTVGGTSGAFLPTSQLIDEINGIQVTCMDVAMPMVIAKAASFGLSGYESSAELDSNRSFFDRMEQIRIEAGRKMGMGDVANSVTPKFGLLAPPKAGGTMCTRYFMPWKSHPTMAVTGAQCLAACILTPGSVADSMTPLPGEIPAHLTLEHASGQIEVIVDYKIKSGEFNLVSAGLIRTARLLAKGEVYVPSKIWTG